MKSSDYEDSGLQSIRLNSPTGKYEDGNSEKEEITRINFIPQECYSWEPHSRWNYMRALFISDTHLHCPLCDNVVYATPSYSPGRSVYAFHGPLMDRIQARTDKAKQSYESPAKWNPNKALFPLFPTARLIGVFPCNSNWFPTVWWMKYSKWALLIPIMMDVYQIIYGIASPDEVMSVAMFNIVLHEVRCSCEMVSFCGHLYSLINNREALKNISRHLKSRISREKERLFCCKSQSIFCIFNFCLGTFILNWKTVWTKSIVRRVMITGVSITNTYITFLTALYCSIMEILTFDFERVNSTLAKGADVNTAIKQHQFLNDLCNTSGQLFSLHLIGHCMKIAVTIVQDVHLCIQNVLLPPTDITIAFAVVSALQASYEFTYLYLITTYSEKVHNESLRFYRALSKSVLRHQKYYTDREITTYLSLKRTVKLTAGSFFELNRPVFTSVLGGCITYIVIVIQLSRTGE